MKKNAVVFFVFYLVFSSAVYADGKKEAAKKIDELNHKMMDAAKQHDLQTAITDSEDALSTARLFFGEDSLEAAKAMNNTANLYMYAGHAPDAAELYQKSLEITIKKAGPESTETADSYFNLAMCYASQNKFDDARAALNKAVEIRKKKLGETHPDTQKAEKMLEEI